MRGREYVWVGEGVCVLRGERECVFGEGCGGEGVCVRGGNV